MNEELQPVWGDQASFVQRWQFAQGRNVIDAKTIDRIIKSARRQQYRITGKANKFLNDLNAEVEQGWTGWGQTNRLLGRIAMRSYIFGHVLYADAPLEGAALVEDIMNTAMALPGYQEWCRHQHEIAERARDWAASTERSKYFHYGFGKTQLDIEQLVLNGSDISGWNQQQQQGARERIHQAVASLLDRGTLPAGITDRFDALVKCGISGSTLYRHRNLWHPRHLEAESNRELQMGWWSKSATGRHLAPPTRQTY